MSPEFGPAWIPVLDTAEVTGSAQDSEPVDAGAKLQVAARAMVVLRAAPG
jgi:hypothetical protein